MTFPRSFFPLALSTVLCACGGASTAMAPASTPPSTAQDAPAPDVGEAPTNEPAQSIRVSTYVEMEVPLFSEHFETTPLVSVGDETITLRDLTTALARPTGDQAAHVDATPARSDTYETVLERLIDTRLLLAEAHSMGLDEDPRVVQAIADFEDVLLRTMVRDRAVSGVTADAAQTEEIFLDRARRWRIRSVLVGDEAAAKELHGIVSQGGDFDTVVDQWIADGKATGAPDAEDMDIGAMLPPVIAAVEKLSPGMVAPVIALQDGYAVLRFEEHTFPENAALRANAAAASLEIQRNIALRTYFEELTKKHARLHERRIARLDFEARRPGFRKLAKSDKPLIEIDGLPPITIADLAASLEKDFFHGIESAIREKKLNDKKQAALQQLLAKKLLLKQGLDDRLRETEEFRAKVRDKRIELVVGLFLREVVLPEVRLTEEEVQSYYEEHAADYLLPEFVRLDSMGFSTADAATDAAQALSEETSWEWLLANADDLAEGEARTLPENKRLLTMSGLPAQLGSSLTDAKVGAVTTYRSPSGIHYVVRLVERIAPRPKPIAEVRSQIIKRLSADKAQQEMDEWTSKLREVYPVRRYMTAIATRLEQEVDEANGDDVPRPASDRALPHATGEAAVSSEAAATNGDLP